LAMLVCQRKSSEGVLYIWDVARQGQLKKIEILQSPFPLPENNRTDPRYEYEPTNVFGDVSPNGKYIALGAKSGLVIVSVEDGKEIGTILSPVPFIAHKSVRFSPDGKELWSLGVCMEPKQQFEFTVAVWDFATGRLLRRSPLVQQINNYMA